MRSYLHAESVPQQSHTTFARHGVLDIGKRGQLPAVGSRPPVLRRISRFALQQRSRIDAPDPADGPRRLMWAILKDTLACYHANANATSVHGQRLFREAERWLLSRDLSWMFSFENVCAVLDIDSECLRNELGRWRRARCEHA